MNCASNYAMGDMVPGPANRGFQPILFLRKDTKVNSQSVETTCSFGPPSGSDATGTLFRSLSRGNPVDPCRVNRLSTGTKGPVELTGFLGQEKEHRLRRA